MKRRQGSYFYNPPAPKPVQGRWNVWMIVKTIFRRASLALGGLMLFSLSMAIVLGLFARSIAPVSLPKEMVLVANITEPLGETTLSPSFAAPFSSMGFTVSDMVDMLDRAARDKHVKGLLVSLDHAGIELAHIQELRSAVKRFRESGKFAYLYTSSFGDLGSGLGAYYFASAFEQIWMQPVGFLTLSGISIEMPFARDALDKIGVRPEFLHREEYKSAMESFTHAQMTPENREMMDSLLKSISGTVFADISKDRNLAPQELKTLIDKGLLTGDAALKGGLIDQVDYADKLLESVKNQMGKKDIKDLPLVSLEDYAAVPESTASTHGARVALVRISGEIVTGDDYEPGYATSDYIAGAILEASQNPAIQVIVLRVDSPGGSPTASETIRRAVVKAKERGKKIIVSMGPLAASGGYWVSVDADKIFALPTTLTGSIGVIMGKFEISGLWDKIGVNWEGVTWGENAQLWSMNTPLSDQGRAALDEAIEDTYQAFLTRVAEGRKMKPNAVREVAKGRAWTGLQAKKIGLVDEIGGLDVALDAAAREAGFKNRHALSILELPEPPTPFEQLENMLRGQGILMPESLLSTVPEGMRSLFRAAGTVERSGPIQTYDPFLREMR